MDAWVPEYELRPAQVSESHRRSVDQAQTALLSYYNLRQDARKAALYHERTIAWRVNTMATVRALLPLRRRVDARDRLAGLDWACQGCLTIFSLSFVTAHEVVQQFEFHRCRYLSLSLIEAYQALREGRPLAIIMARYSVQSDSCQVLTHDSFEATLRLNFLEPVRASVAVHADCVLVLAALTVLLASARTYLRGMRHMQCAY